jgi:hypothetical protein
MVAEGRAAEDKSKLLTVFASLVESRLKFLEEGAWKKFMVSPELKSWQTKIIKRIEAAKQAKENENGALGAIGAGIDLNYVLQSMLGEYYFNNWVFSPNGPGPVGGQIFGLIMEIYDFKKSRQTGGDTDMRQRRCNTILKRFSGKELGNMELQAVQDACVADQENNSEKQLLEDPQTDMFDEACARAVQQLGTEGYFAKFKASEEFKELCVQVAEDKRRMLAGGGMKKQEDRSSELTFGMVINDKLGLHFFKQVNIVAQWRSDSDNAEWR